MSDQHSDGDQHPDGDSGTVGSFGRLREVAGVLATDDPRGLGDKALLGATVELALAQRRLDAAQAHVLGELEARGLPDRVHGHRTSSWLAADTSQPVGRVKARVATANALRQHFELFDEAFSAGRIDWAYCRALQHASNVRILPGLVELQEYLLSRVPGRRYERWAAELRAICAELDQDGPEPEDGERDSLVISETGGVTVITGCLHGSEGEELSQAIEAETERLFRRAQADAKECPDLVVPGWMALRAKALLELIRRAQHTCTTNGRQTGADITLIIQAEQADGQATPDTSPAGGNDQSWMGPIFGPDGIPLARTPGTVDANLWRLCCSANIRSFVVDGDNLPIWATLNQRLASPLQRRMVLVRDGGCVFPGCDAPLAWVQIHHVIPAAAGGPTEAPNLAALCAHHHGVTHRTGWHMTANLGPTGEPNGRFTWTTPGGHTIDSQRHQHWQPPPGEQPEQPPTPPTPPTPIRPRQPRPPNKPTGYPDTG